MNYTLICREKLVFRPHSTDSITHRKVTLSMADRSNKSQKVKVLTAVGSNPESKKAVCFECSSRSKLSTSILLFCNLDF